MDLLFLDIELINTDGIKVGNFIREEMENMETDIVYISSNSSYAMNLFRLQPIDFLIKPLTEERIEEVMLRAIKQYARKRQMFDYQIKGSFYKLMGEDELVCLESSPVTAQLCSGLIL